MKSNVSATVLFQIKMPLLKADFAFIMKLTFKAFLVHTGISVARKFVFWKLNAWLPVCCWEALEGSLGCEMHLPAWSVIPLPHSWLSGSDAIKELFPQMLQFVSWCQSWTGIAAKKFTGLAEGCTSYSEILFVLKNVGWIFPIFLQYVCVYLVACLPRGS